MFLETRRLDKLLTNARARGAPTNETIRRRGFAAVTDFDPEAPDHIHKSRVLIRSLAISNMNMNMSKNMHAIGVSRMRLSGELFTDIEEKRGEEERWRAVVSQLHLRELPAD